MVDSMTETLFTEDMTTNTINVTFQFTTDAAQDEAVLRRSMRDTLDMVADRYAGQVTTGSVRVEVNRECSTVRRFQSLMADLIDEGTDPDAITEALAYLGFGKGPGLMMDDKGNAIVVGSTVQVLYVDRGRGAELWMHRGEVVGFGRTRVKVQFPSRGTPQAIGPECLRVITGTAPTLTEQYGRATA
jgi:hypothetical protein